MSAAGTATTEAPAAATAPVAPTESAPRANIPSLSRRLAFATLRLIPLILFYIVVPIVGLSELQAHGVGSSFPLPTVTAFGAVLSVLSTARYVAKPTRAFGPLGMLASGAAILYLVYFAGFATVSLHFQSVGIALSFGALLLLLALVPLFGLAASAVTTLEDARHPGERLPFDFPAK